MNNRSTILSDEPRCSLHFIAHIHNYMRGGCFYLGSLTGNMVCQYENKKAILKIAQSEETDEAGNTESLPREIRIFETIAHAPVQLIGADCLIGYYGFGYEASKSIEVSSTFAIMMEFASLGSLEKNLKNNNPISLTNILAIMLAIAKGLNALHHYKIVYCDMKPANILLTENETGVHAKIADFDISKFENEIRECYGTYAYAAPEVILNEKQDKKSDIFSMGLIFWAMITRETPQQAKTYDVEKQVAQSKTRPPIPAGFPKGIEKIIKRCWEHDPNDRPSAVECVDVINEYIQKKAVKYGY